MRGKIVIGRNNTEVVKYINESKNKLSDKYLDEEAKTFEELFEMFVENGRSNRGFWVGNTIYNSIIEGTISLSDMMVIIQTFNCDLYYIADKEPMDDKIIKFTKFVSENDFEYDILKLPNK